MRPGAASTPAETTTMAMVLKATYLAVPCPSVSTKSEREAGVKS